MKLTCLIKVNIIFLEQGFSGPHMVCCVRNLRAATCTIPLQFQFRDPMVSPKTSCS